MFYSPKLWVSLKVRSHEWFCSAQVPTAFRLSPGVTMVLTGGKGYQLILNYLLPIPVFKT